MHVALEQDEDFNLDRNEGHVASTDFAKKNAKQRLLAWQWISGQPFPHLLLMVILLKGFSDMLKAQLQLGGQTWDVLQEAEMAKSMMLGNFGYNTRKYAPVQAALGSIENAFMDEIKTLFFKSAVWDCFPSSVHHRAFRALAFRLLSRGGAATYQLYAHGHSKFPFPTFLMLVDPHKGKDIIDTPDCCKDSWTLSLQSQFDFTQVPKELLMILALTAVCQYTDIGHIEANHASIRRQVTQRSVQTWVYGVAAASTQWVLQRLRKHKCNMGTVKRGSAI
eukprot:159372-Amphidinium_carterae.1